VHYFIHNFKHICELPLAFSKNDTRKILTTHSSIFALNQ